LNESSYDLAILGGGTGGYSAAIRASELGLKVALIEKDKLGGVCLHRGCIPTKSLLRTAESIEDIKRADKFGVEPLTPKLNWKKMMSSKENVVDQLFKGLNTVLASHDIDILKGVGDLLENGNIKVTLSKTSKEISADNYILATGSRPNTLDFEVDGKTIITSDHALRLDEKPRSVIILGGGAIGLEFAYMWASFGIEVTVVEVLPRIIATEDTEISNKLEQALTKKGINILTNTLLESIDKNKGKVKAKINNEGETRTIEADKLFIAVGRKAVLDGYGIEKWKIRTNSFIDVDKDLRTSNPHVYAVGDVIDTPQFAHMAFAEGIYVAEHIAGEDPAPIDYGLIPRCIYTHPEIAAVGLSEDEAIEKGLEPIVSKFPFIANSKATILRDTDGLVKIIASKKGPILGIHMIGPKVTELMAEAMLITSWEAFPEELADIIHPHPTLSETISEATYKLLGKPLNISA